MIETLPVPDTRPRLLQPFLDDPRLTEAIVAAAQHGVYRGISAKAESVWMPVIGQGMITYLYTCVYLGEKLNEFTFSKDETQNQARFLAPENPGGIRLRFMVCQGDLQGTLAEVRGKGPVTRSLVMENAPHNPQLQLFTDDEVDGGLLLNVWVVLHMDRRKRLTIQIAVFGEMNAHGSEMKVWDSESLGVYDMNVYEPEQRFTGDLPQSVINPVILREQEDIVSPETDAEHENERDGTTS